MSGKVSEIIDTVEVAEKGQSVVPSAPAFNDGNQSVKVSGEVKKGSDVWVEVSGEVKKGSDEWVKVSGEVKKDSDEWVEAEGGREEAYDEKSKAQWYPVRVFFGRAEAIKEAAEDAGLEFFYPMRLVEKFTSGGLKYVEEPLVCSLIFLKATKKELLDIKARNNTSLVPYYDRTTHAPLVVPDKQMDLFMRLCELKDAGLVYLGDDEPKYHEGDRVRVTDGVFKGFEGHIKRIRHDRKLIVTIEGVAAFATRFIPPSMLEKVETEK